MSPNSPAAAPVPAIVVLDDPSAPEVPGAWADALARAGWSGATVAPTPAGWHGAPPIVGGNTEMTDPLFSIVERSVAGDLPGLEPLATGDDAPPVAAVVGIGVAGWSATLWALAGRAAGLVLINGSGGPWVATQERTLRTVDLLRSQRKAIQSGQPRRAAPGHGNRKLALEAADSIVAEGLPALMAVTATDGPSPAHLDGEREMADRLGVELATLERGSAAAPEIRRWLVAQDLA